MRTVTAEVRYAEPEDASSLASVHDTAWRNAYCGLIPYQSLNRMLERRDTAWWAQAIRNKAAILVLEFAGETVGYATLGRNRTAALKVEGEVYELYLRPEYQGLGFGRRLFDSARELLKSRGMRGVVVWALADNSSAVSFYTATGGIDVAEGQESFGGRSLRKVAFVWN